MEPNQKKSTQPFIVVGNWDTQSKQLKKNYSQLTDTDLKFETGKENELLNRIETRLSKSREEVIAIIKKNQPEKIQVAPRKPARSF